MKHARATEDIQERAALYALGALTQHEAHSFGLHLREGCSACQTLAKHFERIVEALGHAPPEVEPPYYLRDVLAARIEREPRSAAADIELPVKTERKVQLDIPAPALLRPPLTSQPPPRNLLPWVLAVCFAIAAAFCFYAWKDAVRSSDKLIASEKEKAETARTGVEKLNKILAAQQGRATELDQIYAALDSPGAQVLFLAPQGSGPSPVMVIFWDKQKNQGVLTGHLPAAPPEKDYQLWFLTPKSKISAGLLEADVTGHSFRIVDVPPVLTQIGAAAITLEPKGGSEQPTTRPLALWVAS